MRNTILDPSIICLSANEESQYVVTYVFMVVVIYKVQNFEGTLLKFILNIKCFPNIVYLVQNNVEYIPFVLVLIVTSHFLYISQVKFHIYFSSTYYIPIFVPYL